MQKVKRLKEQKAITLVALVITIILLLILAGISIQALTNQGLFGQAENARKETKRAQVTEWLNLKLMEVQMNNPTATTEEIIEGTRLASEGNAELAKMGKNVVVDTNTSTIEDGEPVDVYFYVQVDEDVYKVEVAGAKFIGEKGKFPPVIIVENITPTTNSITVKIKTSRNEEGKIEFYIKKEGETEYTSKYTAEGEEAKGLEYKFENLEQNKSYSIKIVVTAKNGQTKEYTKDLSLGSIPAGEGLIAFTPVTWSNGNGSTTISSTETGYTIQYQINSTSESGWITGTSVTGLVNGDTLYARLWDGTNGGTEAVNNIIAPLSLPTIPATTIAEAQSDYMLTKTVNSPMQDAYGNKITVPAGFKIKADSTTNNATTVDKGIVIIDSNENEFVWIPTGKIYTDADKTEENSKTINLNRYTFDSNGNPTAKNDAVVETYYQELATSTLGNTTAKDINDFKTKASATGSGGFYIGRYEARKNSSGTITEKGTDSVWNNITQPNAATQARNMYQNATTFTSDLVNSYAWDTATLFLQTFGTNSKYSRQTRVSSSYASTGTNNQTTKDVQCNVYDMASNTIEWTTETCSRSSYPCVNRGGNCALSDDYTSLRFNNSTSSSYGIYSGFRPLLYV